MPELSDEIYTDIQKLCAEGDELAGRQLYRDAVLSYRAAWDLLPQPKIEWDAALWILGALGDANFLCGDHAAATENLNNAMLCHDGIGNPFLHLRLGQCQFEIGRLDAAADNLMRAYMGAGREIFGDEHPKYLLFLKSRATDIAST